MWQRGDAQAAGGGSVVAASRSEDNVKNGRRLFSRQCGSGAEEMTKGVMNNGGHMKSGIVNEKRHQ
jgi:hypothetical protein